jgi:nucleotidyltransferase substrate binding protein (TIGR01987 family)
MTTDTSPRWQQRLGDLASAQARLAEALAVEQPNDFVVDAAIQRFEFTFELAWKTLKDYLESQGLVGAATPKTVIQEAFQANLLGDGRAWSAMLESRNLLSHTYNLEVSRKIYADIKRTHGRALAGLVAVLKEKTK